MDKLREYLDIETETLNQMVMDERQVREENARVVEERKRRKEEDRKKEEVERETAAEAKCIADAKEAEEQLDESSSSLKTRPFGGLEKLQCWCEKTGNTYVMLKEGDTVDAYLENSHKYTTINWKWYRGTVIELVHCYRSRGTCQAFVNFSEGGG